MAHRFRGLELESEAARGAPLKRSTRSPDRRAGKVDAGDAGDAVEMEVEEAGARKRARFIVDEQGIKERDVTQAAETGEAATPRGAAAGSSYADMVRRTYLTARLEPLDHGHLSQRPKHKGSPPDSSNLQKPGASTNEDSSPLPLDPSASSSAPDTPSGPTSTPASAEVVDPLRASLTWHEDEITIYDPDDSDDDGTGINGIGFKPTPALAYSRTVKRRQQIADYRKREEREARARRSQRRRATPPVEGLVELDEKVEGRRVRFLEEPGVQVC
jgi:hypothetical protein